MTYVGEIHNGVVVLKDAPALEEGTRVRVEVDLPDVKPRRGSPAAVLAALRKSGGWAGPDEELDRLVAEVHQMKQEELKAQLAQPDPEL